MTAPYGPPARQNKGRPKPPPMKKPRPGFCSGRSRGRLRVLSAPPVQARCSAGVNRSRLVASVPRGAWHRSLAAWRAIPVCGPRPPPEQKRSRHRRTGRQWAMKSPSQRCGVDWGLHTPCEGAWGRPHTSPIQAECSAEVSTQIRPSGKDLLWGAWSLPSLGVFGVVPGWRGCSSILPPLATHLL
jgi:hypothetical protein